MTAADLDAQSDALAHEEGELRVRLRALENELHATLHGGRPASPHSVDATERAIRIIVLRLVEIERERIDLRVASALR